MQSKISVIIPIYNVEEYLDECIQSVVEQTYKNLEIILVDDGSTDASLLKCNVWRERDNRIKMIYKKHGGVSEARNYGLDIATGEYISFIDSDDWILPNMYERMLQVIQKENADIAACNICSYYPDHEVEWGCNEYYVGNAEQTLEMLYNDTKYPVSALDKIYKRECWDNIRFPVGKICEDAFVAYKLVHYAKRIVQIPEAYYCYRIRPKSIMTSDFSIKRMDEEEAWRANYQFISEFYPSIYKKAYRFYLQRVHVLINTISEEQREDFSKQFNYLKNIMKENILFIMFKSGMNWKYRVKYILDYIKL